MIIHTMMTAGAHPIRLERRRNLVEGRSRLQPRSARVTSLFRQTGNDQRGSVWDLMKLNRRTLPALATRSIVPHLSNAHVDHGSQRCQAHIATANNDCCRLAAHLIFESQIPCDRNPR